MCMLFVSYYLKILYSKKLLESVHFPIPWFNEFRLISFAFPNVLLDNLFILIKNSVHSIYNVFKFCEYLFYISPFI